MAEQATSITCPRCGLTSHHPADVAYRYCENCGTSHDYLDGLPPFRACGVDGCRADVSRWRCAMHRRIRQEV